MMGVQLAELPEVARSAWLRLRDDLLALLGDDLVAMWAFGGSVAVDEPPRPADLDTYVVVRTIDATTARRIDQAHDDIARGAGAKWDAWYVLEADARGREAPRHAYRSNRRDTTWAVNRAHWIAGRYAQLHGLRPAEVVPAPTWSELEAELDRELEHIERHVAEGDTDPYEATYAILNGSRILRAVETRDVVISKRAAGRWAFEHLPVSWHPALNAARRTYDGRPHPEDAAVLARDMGPFVEMVRGRLPSAAPRPPGWQPRWSGY